MQVPVHYFPPTAEGQRGRIASYTPRGSRKSSDFSHRNAPDRWVLMKSCLGAGWRCVLGISLFTCLAAIYAAADWPPITPEEQAIKDVAGQPGASAIILQRQEVADDMNNFHSTYKRIKVLNEAGRKYADV